MLHPDNPRVVYGGAPFSILVITNLCMVSLAVANKERTLRARGHTKISGDHSGEETPVPIPNTVVKLSSAKNTAISRGGKIGRCQDILHCPAGKSIG